MGTGSGIKACAARLRIYFTTAQALIKELALAEKEGILVDKLAFFSRLHLMIGNGLYTHFQS